MTCTTEHHGFAVGREVGGCGRCARAVLGLLGLAYIGVLPLSVVENSDFSANRLTALETLLMLASQGASQAPHFKQ